MTTEEILKLVIRGRIPSKKNSRINFVRFGRVMSLPSTAYRGWHKEASAQLDKVSKDHLEKVSLISMVFFAPDKRKADLTNKAESISDLLVDIGVLADDNWYVISKVELIFGGVDKEDPRCEVTIHKTL